MHASKDIELCLGQVIVVICGVSNLLPTVELQQAL